MKVDLVLIALFLLLLLAFVVREVQNEDRFRQEMYEVLQENSELKWKIEAQQRYIDRLLMEGE